jgi:hypothetical protein
MPTIFWKGPYRIYFYSSDKVEPIHVHVQRGGKVVKFWLNPVRVAGNTGYSVIELRQIRRIIIKEKDRIEGTWYEFFGNN